MEEECGNLEQSLFLLRKGAQANSYNEVLLTKAIKQHERLNNLTGAREMLGKLQEEGIDNTWRTVLEGSLLESRAGNIVIVDSLDEQSFMVRSHLSRSFSTGRKSRVL
jgi:hypothetical protein